MRWPSAALRYLAACSPAPYPLPPVPLLPAGTGIPVHVLGNPGMQLAAQQLVAQRLMQQQMMSGQLRPVMPAQMLALQQAQQAQLQQRLAAAGAAAGASKKGGGGGGKKRGPRAAAAAAPPAQPIYAPAPAARPANPYADPGGVLGCLLHVCCAALAAAVSLASPAALAACALGGLSCMPGLLPLAHSEPFGS